MIALREKEAEDERDLEEDKLEGISIPKPEDRPRTCEPVGAGPPPEIASRMLLLRRTAPFKSFSERALADVAAAMEAQRFRAGELIYREGERQHWLGLLESGSAGVHVGPGQGDQPHADIRELLMSRMGQHVRDIREGDIFGELAVLGVREQRTSTITAATECSALVLELKSLAVVLRAHTSERALLAEEAERWRVFLTSALVAPCHPELAYQLRRSSTAQVLKPGDRLVLGTTSGEQAGALPSSTFVQTESGAIVECGGASTAGELSEQLGPGAVICDAAVLGVKGSVVVTCDERPCHVALVSRSVFWSLVSVFPKEREAFVRQAMDRLPLVTIDILSCKILAHLQGSPGFWRVVQGSVRQRVVHPGAEVCHQGEDGGVLTFFQEGLAEVVIGGHKARELATGDSCNELSFIGAVSRCGATVRALQICVLQELHRADIEYHLTRHHAIRAHFRELTKLRPHFKRDLSATDQARSLQEVSFFSGCPGEFLEDIVGSFEDRIFLPGQVILPASGAGEAMALILEGAAERTGDSEYVKPIGGPEVAGEIGMICSCARPPEDLVAVEVVCAKLLRRSAFLDCLRRWREVKCHFESVVNSYMLEHSIEELVPSPANIFTLPFFRGCDSRLVYKLDLSLERHVFFRGEVIVEEGTDGEEMYILYSGVMDVQVRGTKVGTLKGGQCFGEMAVLGLVSKRTATIVSRGLCDVRILSRKLLEEYLLEFPEERAKFDALAATRHIASLERQLGGKIRSLCRFFHDCDPKFAAALCDATEDRLFVGGQTLMKEGETGDWMALIYQGIAAVSIGGVRIGTLREGDIAGEMGAVGISPLRTATIAAEETCFVRVLRRSELHAALEGFPEEKHKLRGRAARWLEMRGNQESVRYFNVFRNCPRSLLEFVDQKTRRWLFFQGDFVTREGSTARQLLMVSSGTAEVIRSGETIGWLSRGDVVGELACLGASERRTATVLCKEICDIYSLSRRSLEEAIRRWPHQCWALRALAAGRMRRDIDRNVDKSFLLRCQLFEQCSAKFIQCISSHLEDELFLPGEDLCREGENGDTMFVLMKGTLSVVVKGQVVNQLLQGSIIGEIVVLGLSNVRTATLRAKEPCLVAVLHRQIFMKYLGEFPREMVQFQEVGTARLAQISIGEANLFRRQALFRDSSKAFLDALCKRLVRKFVFAGQVIVKECTESTEMYALSSGRASVERRGIRVSEIDAGLSFGEMAVLGVTTLLSLTVRAETLCDMQVLRREDLEALLDEFAAERSTLYRSAALIAREALASVTDLEVLAEVPLLRRLGRGVLQTLSEVAQSRLSYRGEYVLPPSESGLVVILQGAACVEIAGTAVRELSEGDTFGEVSLLGCAVATGAAARAATGCLYLHLAQADILAAVEDSKAGALNQWHLLVDELTCHPAPRHTTLSRFQAIQHLDLRMDQLAALCGKCEEAIFMPQQGILSPHMSAQVLLLILAGRARAGRGRDSVLLEQGSSIGKVPSEPLSSVVGQCVTAVTSCRTLMLHQQALAELLQSWPDVERTGLLARMETLPGRHCTESCLLGLRQRTDALAEKFLKAARVSLKVSTSSGARRTKLWRTAKLGVVMSKALKGIREKGDKEANESEEASKGHRPTLLESWRMSCSSHALSPKAKMDEPPSPRQGLVRRSRLEWQEAQESQSLRRLTEQARRASCEARRDELQLKSMAQELRTAFAAVLAKHQQLPQPEDQEELSKRPLFQEVISLEEGENEDDDSDGQEPWNRGPGFSSHRRTAVALGMSWDSELEAMQRASDAADRRVERLLARLEQAYDARQQLLRRLRPSSRAVTA